MARNSPYWSIFQSSVTLTSVGRIVLLDRVLEVLATVAATRVDEAVVEVAMEIVVAVAMEGAVVATERAVKAVVVATVRAERAEAVAMVSAEVAVEMVAAIVEEDTVADTRLLRRAVLVLEVARVGKLDL